MTEEKIALFSGRQLGTVIREKLQSTLQDIDNIDANTLLNTSLEDWYDYYERNCKFEILELLKNEISIDREEALLPVMNFFSGYTQAKVTKFSYFITFKGEQELFRYQPSVSIGELNNALFAEIYDVKLTPVLAFLTYD
ncbi:hypothetical protein BV372_19720 [Nostoc sp. T09]|uniref:hypothetical protein n=1 Tax=Nostoc sp. T09 TaxID=1932621 RepID=UPI000A39E47C|nr:hypothetical protein [Nostoc sp. T09]OUL31994.1 hypothetical protein BV372_19720 [Nostoc sp. T09]